ncbi:MAG: hypothetical protein MZV63_34015 [Marinilabiliales bacterium]|nr:hypothetical protein [Marinilabiliales bacterium]
MAAKHSPTWGLRTRIAISRIVVHPTNPEIVYAGVSGTEWTPNKDRGFYMTTDGGKTWVVTLQKDDLTGVIDVDMDPFDPNIIYASTWQRIRKMERSPHRIQLYRLLNIQIDRRR